MSGGPVIDVIIAIIASTWKWQTVCEKLVVHAKVLLIVPG